MIDDRSLERSARSWIELGPTSAPPDAVEAALRRIATTPQERDWHVPWRTRRMTMPMRLVMAAVIGALIIGAAAVIGGIGSRPPAPSPAPTTAPSPAAVPSGPATVIPPLTQAFTSTRYGYVADYAFGWTVTPAATSWTTVGSNLWGSGINDELKTTDVRFSGASMALATGQTADQWISAYAQGANVASWPRITIGGQSGYLTADGSPAATNAIAPNSVFFDAVIVVGGRAYNFDADGHLDRAYFQALMDGITFYPLSAIERSALEKTFVSPWYGYSVARKAEWTVTPATAHWTGVDNARPKVDEIAITGTDSIVSIASQPLPKGTTLDAWLVPFHANTTANVPQGCDGGDPSTWPTTQIGDQTGRYYLLCNAAEAVVSVGGRVYVFSLGNDTFTAPSHFQVASWLELLKNVTFDPTKAVDK